MDKNINNCIEMARMSKGMNIQELADKLHIKYSVMKGIEMGAIFPSLDILTKMCLILEFSSDALLFKEMRDPLSLNGLNQKQISIVRNLYRGLKELDEGDNNGLSR